MRSPIHRSIYRHKCLYGYARLFAHKLDAATAFTTESGRDIGDWLEGSRDPRRTETSLFDIKVALKRVPNTPRLFENARIHVAVGNFCWTKWKLYVKGLYIHIYIYIPYTAILAVIDDFSYLGGRKRYVRERLLEVELLSGYGCSHIADAVAVSIVWPVWCCRVVIIDCRNNTNKSKRAKDLPDLLMFLIKKKETHTSNTSTWLD